jgi:UDP-glucose 4-epimerase
VRVLVTGGAGFIGSHIADALLEQGHEVAILDNLTTGRRENVPAAAKFYELDLRDRDAVLRTVADFAPEAVTHQAAQASVAISVREPKLDAEVNVIGGLNLLDACTAPGARVERLIFASTGGAIYGEVPEGTRAREDGIPCPISPYAIHKQAFERLLSVYGTHRGLRSTTLRYGNVYGPRQDPHGEAGVVAIFFSAVLAGSPLRVNARREPGDDGCVRDYVYVSDVAAANVQALAGKITEPVMNVGTGVATTTRALAEGICRVSGREVPFTFGPLRAGDLERSVLDPTLPERLLGRLVTMEEGLAKTHAFYRTRAS